MLHFHIFYQYLYLCLFQTCQNSFDSSWALTVMVQSIFYFICCRLNGTEQMRYSQWRSCCSGIVSESAVEATSPFIEAHQIHAVQKGLLCPENDVYKVDSVGHPMRPTSPRLVLFGETKIFLQIFLSLYIYTPIQQWSHLMLSCGIKCTPGLSQVIWNFASFLWLFSLFNSPLFVPMLLELWVLSPCQPSLVVVLVDPVT